MATTFRLHRNRQAQGLLRGTGDLTSGETSTLQHTRGSVGHFKTEPSKGGGSFQQK